MSEAVETQIYSSKKAMQEYAQKILAQLPKVDRVRDLAQMNDAILGMLKLLGECSGSRRVYLFDRLANDEAKLEERTQLERSKNTQESIAPSLETYCASFEWCAPGVSSQKEKYQSVRSEGLHGWTCELKKGNVVTIRNVETIREAMPQKYEEMKKQDIYAEITVPIFSRDRLSSFIVLENPYENISELFVQQVVFVGAHLNSARENLRMVSLLEANVESLKREREILKVLCEDSTSVFKVDLAADTAEIVKIDRGSNASTFIFPEKNSHLCYTKEMRRFYDQFVLKETAPDYMEVFDPKNLMNALMHTDKISYRFQMIPNRLGQQYFEIRATRLDKNIDTTDSAFRVLVDFRYIDHIVIEERRKQKELDNANQANEAKSEFLSRMSHDIRTPMNAIMGFANIAQENIDDQARVKDCLNKIQLSGKNLQQLINDVLDISQIESGKFTLVCEPVNLSEICDFYKKTVGQMAADKKITFDVSLHDITKNIVMTDSVRLGQVYMNLLSNAVKYTQPGGWVSFEVYEKKSEKTGKICLVSIVRDTGIGMSPEFMKNMYSKFSRAVDTRVNKVRGSGLGLAIVKEIVDQMGGTIQAKSELGKGSTFTVTLELSYTDEMCTKRTSDRDSSKLVDESKILPEDRQIRLLIAEDNDLNYEVLAEQLSDRGVLCERAVDGVDCIQKFAQVKAGYFDAILMDMQMPVMGGLEASKRIRAMDCDYAKKIPIIALTANAYHEDIQTCMDAGMNAHLAKPVEIEDVMNTIAKFLN